jgi:hypothetical protein
VRSQSALTPSLDEFRAIVTSIREQKYADTAEESADFIESLGLAGLGQAETSGLTWANVNLDRGQLLTFRQKTRSGFAVPSFRSFDHCWKSGWPTPAIPHRMPEYSPYSTQKGSCERMRSLEAAKLFQSCLSSNVHHNCNRKRRRREGDRTMAGPPGRRKADSRYVQPRETGTQCTYGGTDDVCAARARQHHRYGGSGMKRPTSQGCARLAFTWAWQLQRLAKADKDARRMLQNLAVSIVESRVKQ